MPISQVRVHHLNKGENKECSLYRLEKGTFSNYYNCFLFVNIFCVDIISYLFHCIISFSPIFQLYANIYPIVIMCYVVFISFYAYSDFMYGILYFT